MTEPELLIEQLKNRLQQPLPGNEAQMRMAPESRQLFPAQSQAPKPSAVLILLYRQNHTLTFPIIRRPLYDGYHSGQMALPGGKWEPSDKNLTETALREACEEIGVCTHQIEIIGQLTNLLIPVSNNLVTPFIGYVSTQPVFNIEKNEVDEIFEIDLAHLLDNTWKKQEKWPFMGKEWDVPFYFFHQQKVWGATAMILSELEALLREIE